MSQLARPMSLLAMPPNRQILDNPLEAVTLFDFTGEAEFGELCFKKGQHVLVFCEDMSEGWTLAMLVDEKGNEVVLDPQELRLTRGLLPQGFVEYTARSEESGSTRGSVPTISTSNADTDDITPKHTEGKEYASTTDFLNGVVKGEAPEEVEAEGESVQAEKGTTAEPETTLEILASDTINVAQGAPNAEDGNTAGAPEHTEQDEQSQTEAIGADSGAGPLTEEGVVHSKVEDRIEIKATSPSTNAQPVPTRPPVKARYISSASYLRSSDPVEKFILEGSSKSPSFVANDQREVHDIEDGKWVVKIPAFHVAVPSYQQNQSLAAPGRGEYTTFRIVSSIPTPRNTEEAATVEEGESAPEYRQISVQRRYTHFQQLHTILRAGLPLSSIPDLPEKRLTGNFSKEFLDVRRRDLERYLRRTARHALVRSNRAFLEFLGCEDNAVFQISFPRALMRALTAEPDSFFARIKHDTNYFDRADLLDEARDQHERFSTYVRAVEKGGGVSGMQNSLHGYREGMRGTGLAMKELSHSLLLLNSGLAHPVDLPAHARTASEPEDPNRRLRHRARIHHMQNTDGAFCWREDCPDCLSTTKAVQATAEALSTVSDLYEANASTVLLPPQELLVEYSLPRQRYENLLSRHEMASKRLEEAIQSDGAAEEGTQDSELVSRCETVLSATAAEIEHAHVQRRQDLQTVATSLLDGQIAFHEHALEQLRAARDHYREPAFRDLAAQGPRLPSLLEKAALAPAKPPIPLLKPSSFGLPPKAPSLSYRPVNLLGEAISGAAGSVFGWRSASSAIRAQKTSTTANGADSDDATSVARSNLAASRFVQFLDWTMNSRGEQRKHAT